MTRQLTKEQKQTYIEKAGLHCPFCDSLVEALPLQTPDENDTLFLLVRCEQCGRLLQETYKLVDVEVADRE